MARKKPVDRSGKKEWKPRVLRDGVVAGTFALVVCLFAGAGILDRYVKEGGLPQFAAVIAATLVELANADRIDEGLHGLSTNPKLAAAAQAKADDMADKGYFAHETPEGYDSWHWFELAGYDYAYAGENLAVNFSESIDVQKAWMESPTHRANIVNGNYTEIGIAVAHGTYKGRPATFAVQMFGRPSAEELAARVEANREVAARPPQAGQALAGQADAPQVSVATPAPAGDASATLGEAVAVSAESESIPWWAYLLAEPQQTLRIAYYIIGLFILAGLFFDMELEIRWHHLRHARKVGYLLATMSMLFITADWVFFTEPILAAAGLFGA